MTAIARDPDAPTALEVWAAVCALATDTPAADARAILAAASRDDEAWAILNALGTDAAPTATTPQPYAAAAGGGATWAARY